MGVFQSLIGIVAPLYGGEIFERIGKQVGGRVEGLGLAGSSQAERGPACGRGGFLVQTGRGLDFHLEST